MYSVKKNVLQTVALLKLYEIQHIVISPGSRNSPLIQTFTENPYFKCQIVVDERNAAFHALGIIQATQKPVAICCTSGTALLNYAPAIAEAYYQQLPLIVISADRSPEWIGQMDGQTVPQLNAFGSLIKCSVQIPEINNEQDEWFSNRLINEALIACIRSNQPVHLNIPISEPLFDHTETMLPDARRIHFTSSVKSINIDRFASKWKSHPKRMIVVGQLIKSPQLTTLLEKIAIEHNCVILCEHISNCCSSEFISNFDTILYAKSQDELQLLAPDILITLGGHITSKRLKQLLRTNKPLEHWHLSALGEVVDLYQCLTELIETDNIDFLNKLSYIDTDGKEEQFKKLWFDNSAEIAEPTFDLPFSDLPATGMFLKKLPDSAILHLANSSPIRNAQLFCIDSSVSIFSNRGTNGIESTLPTTIGFASVCEKPVYLLIGDLSFFYTVGSLWNIGHITNLRIVLINNNSGGIFHLLPGLNKSSSLNYVTAEHTTKAENWAKAAELTYLHASNKDELNESLQYLVDSKENKSILLEVTTDMETNKKVFQAYYYNLDKNNHNK